MKRCGMLDPFLVTTAIIFGSVPFFSRLIQMRKHCASDTSSAKTRSPRNNVTPIVILIPEDVLARFDISLQNDNKSSRSTARRRWVMEAIYERLFHHCDNHK